MFKIRSSDILIICAAAVSYTNVSLAIAFLTLGTLGALGRFASEHSERQAKNTMSENTAENISTIFSSFVENMNKKENLH